ncbi:MAG: ATP synthase F1 subunit delta [Defluviitaleaceae bacterium]|nr:ATP synthase F1 subunit delta [Defluviitaleaceae bacterium]
MANLGIRYATALFDISQESGLLDDYFEQAQFVRDHIQCDDVQNILKHPRITSDEKFAFLQKTFGEHIHQDLLGFMRLVIFKNREAFLLPALNKLVEMIKTHKRQTTAKVVSAVPLTDAQAAQLTALLVKKLNKKVDVTVLVDPSVIAGISIHVDGYFLDRTVRTMLKDMKENLKGE